METSAHLDDLAGLEAWLRSSRWQLRHAARTHACEPALGRGLLGRFVAACRARWRRSSLSSDDHFVRSATDLADLEYRLRELDRAVQWSIVR